MYNVYKVLEQSGLWLMRDFKYVHSNADKCEVTVIRNISKSALYQERFLLTYNCINIKRNYVYWYCVRCLKDQIYVFIMQMFFKHLINTKNKE